MKIHFLPSALDDLAWMKEYYETAFPAGKHGAGKNFEATLTTLRDNPNAGTVVETVEATRRFPIKKLPSHWSIECETMKFRLSECGINAPLNAGNFA